MGQCNLFLKYLVGLYEPIIYLSQKQENYCFKTAGKRLLEGKGPGSIHI